MATNAWGEYVNLASPDWEWAKAYGQPYTDPQGVRHNFKAKPEPTPEPEPTVAWSAPSPDFPGEATFTGKF